MRMRSMLGVRGRRRSTLVSVLNSFDVGLGGKAEGEKWVSTCSWMHSMWRGMGAGNKNCSTSEHRRQGANS